MRGGALAVQNPGFSECEGTGAYGGDARSALVGDPQRIEDTLGQGRGGIVTRGNHDGLGLRKSLEPKICRDAEGSRGDHGLGATHPHEVGPAAVGEVHAAEHLNRSGQIEADGSGKRKNDDGVRLARTTQPPRVRLARTTRPPESGSLTARMRVSLSRQWQDLIGPWLFGHFYENGHSTTMC